MICVFLNGLLTVIHLSPRVDILGNQRRSQFIPSLCGMGCKRALVLEREVRVSVLSSLSSSVSIAINELMGRKTILINA